MIPVCPACRAPIHVESHVCGRCGLAVRPTCSNCAEPLMYGMTSCWFCHELIDDPEDVPVMAPPPRAHVVSTASVAAPPVQEARATHPSVPVFTPRHRRSAGGALFEWLVFVIVLTLVLLAVEMAIPRFPSMSPASLALKTRAFPEMGFSLAHPPDWAVKERRDRVSFTAPEPLGKRATRGLRVVSSDLDYDDVRGSVRRLNRKRVEGYRTIDASEDRLDGRDAYMFVFAGDDLRFEQWWVDRGKRTLRLEFWSRSADDQASEVNERIARTLRLL